MFIQASTLPRVLLRFNNVEAGSGHDVQPSWLLSSLFVLCTYIGDTYQTHIIVIIVGNCYLKPAFYYVSTWAHSYGTS